MPTQRTSLTADPYLLRTPGTLHRVDTSQLGARDGVSVGGCCLQDDCNQGRTCPQRTQQQPAARPGLLKPALQWLATAALFCLLAGAMVLMGKPQDH